MSGGLFNIASAFASAVAGGVSNSAQAKYSIAAAGKNNIIPATAPYATVSGGLYNEVIDNCGTISGTL